MSQPYYAESANKTARGTISIVIPSYGHEKYIAQTLDSLLAQTRQPLEIIVLNDGSPDDTSSAVQPYLNKITYIEQHNHGLMYTLNRGIALCRGDYILVIASDDWLEPAALELLGAALDEHPDIGLAYGGITPVDMTGKPFRDLAMASSPTGKHRELARLITANYIAAPTVLVRRAALENAGPFLDFTYSQDWAMWLAIALQGWSLYGVETAVACYRRHPNNLTRPETLVRALEDNLAMLEATRQRFVNTLTPEYTRAFAAGKQRILRALGWHSLEHGMSDASRKWFYLLSKERVDNNMLMGYMLSTLPKPFYKSVHFMHSNLKRLIVHS